MDGFEPIIFWCWKRPLCQLCHNHCPTKCLWNLYRINSERIIISKVFFNKWANPGLFLFYFRSFLVIISIQIEKSIDGVLGIRTRGHRMVGADETTELWRPPIISKVTNKQVWQLWRPSQVLLAGPLSRKYFPICLIFVWLYLIIAFVEMHGDEVLLEI